MMDRIWTIFFILFMNIVVIFSATPSQLKEKPVIILYLSDLSIEDRSKETSLLWATEKVNKYENLPIKLELRPINIKEWARVSYEYLFKKDSNRCEKSPVDNIDDGIIIGVISTIRTPQIWDYFHDKGIPLLFENQIKSTLNHENKLQILKEILEKFSWKNPNIISPETNMAKELSNYGFCHATSSLLPKSYSDIKEWLEFVSKTKANIAVFDYPGENELRKHLKDVNWIYFDNRTIINQLSTIFTVGENYVDFNFTIDSKPISDKVFGVIDIFYFLVNKFKSAYSSECNKKPGLCNEFIEYIEDGNFIKTFNDFKYTSFQRDSTIDSFINYERSVELTKNGDILVSWINKTYNIYKMDSFQLPTKVASYDGESFRWIDSTDHCRSCGKCFSKAQTDYKFIDKKSGRLLIGYLPFMSGNGDGFSCSQSINIAGYGTYMAFLYGLQTAKSLTGMDFDLLLIDECGEALRPVSVLSSIKEQNKINISSALAIIGTINSDLSNTIYQISKSLNTVQVSYGSTSAMFDNKAIYPNFMRTVPSDEQQAEALIMIIKRFKWDCFHLVYDGTSYGRTGAINIRKYAKRHDLLIAVDREISTDYLVGIAGFQILKSPRTKVILYFGMSETGKGLLSDLSRSQAIGKYVFVMSESWGDDQVHIRGLQDVPKALISLKLNSPFLQPKEFQDFYRKHISKPDVYDPWTVNYLRKYKCENSECPNSVHISQYAQYAYLSIVSTAKGIALGLKKICDSTEVCEKLRNQPEALLRELQKVPISGHNIYSGRNGRFGYLILNMKRTKDRIYYKQIGTFVSSTNISLIENSSDASDVDSLCTIKSYLGDRHRNESDRRGYIWAVIASILTIILLCLIVLLLWWRKKTTKIVKDFNKGDTDYNDITDIYVQAKKKHIYENVDREIESNSPETPSKEICETQTEVDKSSSHISQLKYRLLFGEDQKEESRYSATPTKEKDIVKSLMPLDAGYLERHSRYRQSLPLTFDPATRPLPPISERRTPVVKFSTVPKKTGKKIAKEVHANLAFVMDEGSDGSLNDESYSEVVL